MRYIQKNILILIFILSPVGQALSTEQDTVRFIVGPGSEVYYTTNVRIALVATSTVKGINRDIRGSVKWIAAENRPVVQTKLTIGTANFDSGNSARDKEVSNMLNANEYPEITFELQSLLGLEDKPLTEIDGQYVATGILTVRGIPNEMHVPVNVQYTDAILTIEGSTTSKYSDFGIDPPRVAGFVGRAPDELRLHVNLIASREH
jgi:polyisoprenoid-binding protein YceI